MAVEIRVPRLGWSMEEGTLVEWLKQDGDRVEAGDLIFSLEGDKALNEVEAFDRGILRIPPDSPRPGTTIPVGTLLSYIVQPAAPGSPYPRRHRVALHRPPRGACAVGEIQPRSGGAEERG